MARQVLENGVILPAEYSDDWYDDMTSNLTKLDDVIGSDSEKLSSADVGAAALSNNYNDLDNLPTIPTVNDATLTIQKNGVDVQTFTANASSNVTANITVPTKTSDLTNDSNFVDTSNSAVASGITSAKVTDYDTHIADTDIHVTTADKTKWNNGVSQAYVFRYSSTVLVASSTNSNTLLDNTDNLKVGDKVIDSSGVLFSITAIDTANSTFTIGTALIDLALDANVVHTSGNETISGDKVFNNRLIKNIDVVLGTAPSAGKFSNIDIADNNKSSLLQVLGGVYDTGNSYAKFFVQNKTADDGSGLSPTGTLRSCGFNINLPATSTSEGQGSITPRANKATDFGLSSYQWRNLWCEKLFLNGTQLDPSAFVTTDTAQTITEIKTFTNTIKSQKEIEFTGSRLAYILPEFSASYSGLSLCTYGSSGAVKIGSWKVDDNDNTKHVLDTSLGYLNVTTGAVNGVNSVYLTPRNITDSKLGDSANKWKEINGLTPSSLSLPDFSNRVNIAGYISNLSGSTNNYTPTVNGWLYVGSNDASYLAVFDTGSGGCGIRFSDGVVGEKYACIPCQANRTLGVKITCTNLAHAYFIPCQGNV